jgi:hypothetical protein
MAKTDPMYETEDLESDAGGDDEDFMKEIEMESEPLPENVYGLVIASLIRDSHDMHSHGMIKFFRIIASLSVYLIMFSVQVFLIYSTKQLITPLSVKSIRQQYSQFEEWMYTDPVTGEEFLYNTTNGFMRGQEGHFGGPERFATMDDGLKQQICMVPMSQFKFLWCILWIWLVTVLKEVRDAVNKILRILAIQCYHGAKDTEIKLEENADGVVEVQSMPCYIAALCIGVVLIPKVLLCLFMAWLGCRWLTATIGFADVLLNALALGFIFDLADIIFVAAVPYHTRVMVTSTTLPHILKKEKENCRNMFGMLSILVIAAVLAYTYMVGPESWGHLSQHVLPEYKWDIADVCSDYLLDMMNTHA